MIMRQKKVQRNVFSCDFKNLNNSKNLREMNRGRQNSVAVCVKDEIYVIGGFDVNNHRIMSIDKYSFSNNAWENVADMYDTRVSFCACSFMEDVYIIGGGITTTIEPSVRFNTKRKVWEEVGKMNGLRIDAACTVFKGKVVVSGGFNNGYLNSVEAYDHVAESWSNMPTMVERRASHQSVAMKDKLFVVGGWIERSCEVFDSTCNKFVLVNPPPQDFTNYLDETVKITSIGSKLIIFGDQTNSILFYDVENGEWHDEPCEITGHLHGYCCVKLPQL